MGDHPFLKPAAAAITGARKTRKEKDLATVIQEILTDYMDVDPGASFGHATGRRLRQPGMSELEMNWYNTVHDARASDLQYKYHIARLGQVYHGLGPGRVDSSPPRTILRPPAFYTSIDSLEPVIKGRQRDLREAGWDSRFINHRPLSGGQASSSSNSHHGEGMARRSSWQHGGGGEDRRRRMSSGEQTKREWAHLWSSLLTSHHHPPPAAAALATTRLALRDVDHGQVPLLQELRGMGSSYRSFIRNNNNGAKASGESSSAGLYGGGLEDEGAITKFLDALGDWVDPTARQSILEQGPRRDTWTTTTRLAHQHQPGVPGGGGTRVGSPMNLAAYEAAKQRIFGTAATTGTNPSAPGSRNGGRRREQRNVDGDAQEGGVEEHKRNRRRGGRRVKESKQDGQGGQKPRRQRHHNTKTFSLVSVARGEISAAASVDAHREIMKEGELLEEEEEDGVFEEEEVVGPEGTTMLSLDEVPYDRDLQWCNRACEERPRPSAMAMGNRNTNPFYTQSGGGTLLEIEPMDPHYRPDRRRGERDQGGGNRRHNGHDMMGGEGAERELYEDDETGEGGSGRRRRRRRGSRGGRRGTPRQDDEYFVEEKAEGVPPPGPSRRGKSRQGGGGGSARGAHLLPKQRQQQQERAVEDDVEGDLDLERALPLGMLSLSDDEGENVMHARSNHQATPLTSVKALRASPPLELNAQAVPYLPAQTAVRGSWTGPPSHYHQHQGPVANSVPMSVSRRGYFHNQPIMMSQLGRSVKAVE